MLKKPGQQREDKAQIGLYVSATARINRLVGDRGSADIQYVTMCATLYFRRSLVFHVILKYFQILTSLIFLSKILLSSNLSALFKNTSGTQTSK
jgi:hypothetical protein